VVREYRESCLQLTLEHSGINVCSTLFALHSYQDDKGRPYMFTIQSHPEYSPNVEGKADIIEDITKAFCVDVKEGDEKLKNIEWDKVKRGSERIVSAFLYKLFYEN
jgi:hypothetical protein